MPPMLRIATVFGPQWGLDHTGERPDLPVLDVHAQLEGGVVRTFGKSVPVGRLLNSGDPTYRGSCRHPSLRSNTSTHSRPLVEISETRVSLTISDFAKSICNSLKFSDVSYYCTPLTGTFVDFKSILASELS